MNRDALKKELEKLETLYKECSKNLSSLALQTIPDHVHIQRVKKNQLEIKDHIQIIKSKMLPDIIA